MAEEGKIDTDIGIFIRFPDTVLMSFKFEDSDYIYWEHIVGVLVRNKREQELGLSPMIYVSNDGMLFFVEERIE